MAEAILVPLTVIVPDSVGAAFTLLSLNIENEKVGHDDAVEDDLTIAVLTLRSQVVPLAMFITSEKM